MKTIKELKFADTIKALGYKLALEDVLEVIDEVCRKGCPDIANLKKRISG